MGVKSRSHSASSSGSEKENRKSREKEKKAHRKSSSSDSGSSSRSSSASSGSSGSSSSSSSTSRSSSSSSSSSSRSRSKDKDSKRKEEKADKTNATKERSKSAEKSRSRSRDKKIKIKKSKSRSPSPRQKRRGRSATPKPTRIHVGRLTRNVNRDHLMEIFSVYGTVKNIDLPLFDFRIHPTLNKGYGYIEFEKSEEAENAMKHMDGGQIDGQEITAAPVLIPRAPLNRRRSPINVFPRRGPPPRWRSPQRMRRRTLLPCVVDLLPVDEFQDQDRELLQDDAGTRGRRHRHLGEDSSQ